MTLLEYAYTWYDAYQKTKPYMEFRTFVESLKRPSNSPLIESISNGVSIIIEANLGINLGKIKNDSDEFKQLVDQGDKRAVLGYALPIIYKLSQMHGGDDINKTDRLLTKAVEYATDNWEKLLQYDGSTKPSTFLNTFVMRTAKKARSSEAGRVAEILNYPHTECKAAFEDEYNGLNTTAYGTVKDPDVSGNKVIISWQAGPNEGTTTTEYIDDMTFYDIVEDSNKTVSASTPLDTNKGSGGQEETLADTSAFADTNESREISSTNAKRKLDKIINKTADYLADKNAGDNGAKYDELFDLYKSYLSNMIDKSDSATESPSDSSSGESVTELSEKRKELLWSKTRKWQTLAVSLNKLAQKLDASGQLNQIDPSLSAESIAKGLKSLTPVAKEGAKKRGDESVAKTANSQNLKAVLGDTLYDLIYKQKAANIDQLDEIDKELANLSNVRTQTQRRETAGSNVNISNEDKKQLENLMKAIGQKVLASK